MAITKNALIRYQTLNRCFRNPGRRFYINDLLDACNKELLELNPNSEGIKKRQLYDDIKFMQSSQGWSIPLEICKDGRKTFYKYEDSSFSINNQPLNELEAEQIKSAVMVLTRFKGLPQFKWINELIPKLDQTFKLSQQSRDIISFDNNEFLMGLEHLTPLFNAILYEQTLRITYQSFKSGEAQEIVFSPYYLKEYNNRWFLFGKNPEYDNIINLALDRIHAIENSSETFQPNHVIDFDEYFEDIIGVTKPQGAQPIKIILRADPAVAPYIKTKPLHGSQKRVSTSEESKDGYVFSIEVIPNIELEKLLLSHCGDLHVLEPLGFQQKIKTKLEKSLDYLTSAAPLHK